MTSKSVTLGAALTSRFQNIGVVKYGPSGPVTYFERRR